MIFLPKNNELLEKIFRENKICLLMGDFNLNVINFQHHQTTGECLDGLYSNMFLPLITRPSRITSHTATLIDNIFLNDFFDRSRSGLLISDISDHLPIFSIHSINDVSLNYNQDPIAIQSKNPENSVRFLATLEETNWSSLEGYDDPNNAYNSFLMKYSETYNACFPLKKLAGKRKRINKPWLSKALIKCIKRKTSFTSCIFKTHQPIERLFINIIKTN